MENRNSNFCIQRHFEDIPTLETGRIRLLQALEDKDTDLCMLEHIISADPAMTAKVVKLANSPFYRHSERSMGIHQSLLTVGLDLVKCIALSMAVINRLGCDTRYAKDLWSHSYTTALIALSLSNDAREKDHLFTGALLHDLGRMIFLFKAPDAYIPLIEFEGCWPDTDLENDLFSTDHTILGEAVAEQWHFPQEVREIIRNHHRPMGRRSALVSLIDQVIRRQQRGEHIEGQAGIEGIFPYLGNIYKDLVNIILQRYKINSVLIENLF